MATSYVSARVPDELREELERVALESERSVSGEVRIALRRHVLYESRPTPAEGASGPGVTKETP